MKIYRFDEKDKFIEKIINRGEVEIEKYYKIVKGIIEDVKKRKDEAIIELTKKFDGFELNSENYFFDKNDFELAFKKISPSLKTALKYAHERIVKFHENQKLKSWFISDDNGIILGQKVTALEKVGIYVPGGKAIYPSTILMAVTPAKIAGVKKIYVTSPVYDFEKAKSILAGAYISGVDKIFKIGGAQSISALSFGTDWFPKVDKIVGPGNIYVAMAKKILFGIIDIDMFAGPSEILIITDGNVNPEFVANDLLSQAEHDELSSAILITNNLKFANDVEIIVKREIENSPRKEILKKSIINYSGIIIVENIEDAIEIANKIAPEHLEIIVNEPFKYLGKIKNAGAIFIGEYSPEPIGDYLAGPNHILPTGGSARFFSSLSVYDFLKMSSIVYIPEKGFKKLSKYAKILAKEEGLYHHFKSLEARDES